MYMQWHRVHLRFSSNTPLSVATDLCKAERRWIRPAGTILVYQVQIWLTGITHVQQVYTSTGKCLWLHFTCFYRYTLYAVNHAYKTFKLITQWCIKYISLSIKSSLSVVIPQGTIDSESAGTYLIISFYCKMMMFIDITIRQTLKWSRC